MKISPQKAKNNSRQYLHEELSIERDASLKHHLTMLYSPLHWDEAHPHRDAIAPIRLPDAAIIQTGLGREFVLLDKRVW
jgi:hypothetical protein